MSKENIKDQSKSPNPAQSNEPVKSLPAPKHHFPIKIIIVIILLILGGIVSVVAFQTFNSEKIVDQDPVETGLKPVSTNEPTPAETINTSSWQTYRNEEYGFEFMYPQEWKVQKYDGSSNKRIVILSQKQNEDIPEAFSVHVYDPTTYYGEITVESIKENYESYYIFFSGNADLDIKRIEEKNIFVDDYQALQNVFAIEKQPLSNEYSNRVQIYIPVENYRELILIEFSGDDLTILNHILSTFRFIDENR